MIAKAVVQILALFFVIYGTISFTKNMANIFVKWRIKRYKFTTYAPGQRYKVDADGNMVEDANGNWERFI